MEEKRQDLTSEKQKQLLQLLVSQMSHDDPDLYYRSTSQIAFQIEAYIRGDNDLSLDDLTLLAPLDARDIQLLLSLHSGSADS